MRKIVIGVVVLVGLLAIGRAPASAVTCPAGISGFSPAPTSCWPMQGVSTTVTDTIDSNSGTLSGAFTLNQPPGGIACNNTGGSGCSITTPQNYSNPQPMTLYVDFVGTSGGILQLGTSSALNATPYYVLFLDNHGKLTFGVNNFSTLSVIQSPLPYADGNEHKAIVSLGNGGAKLYVDGALVASTGLTLSSYANGFWFFGGINTAGWPLSPSLSQLNGTLVTVAWWNGTQFNDHQAIQLTGGLPTAITNNYCTFTNQIASLNPSTAQAFANKKLTFTSSNQLQVPGVGSTLPVGPNTSIVCQTDNNGNILPGCQIPQGAHVNLSVGTAPPIPMVIPASTSCDLTSIVLSQTDPPEVVSAVAVAGPLFAGSIVTNPPAGTIGTATITAPPAYSQTQASAATVDVNTNGNNQQVILSGNATVNLSDFQNGSVFIVDTTENSTGGFTPTFTVPAGWTLLWPGGSAVQPPIPSLLANSDNLWMFVATSGTTITGTPLVSSAGFPLTGTANFNYFSGVNVAGFQLVKQPPPVILVTSVCSGTCATSYQYEVACLTDTGTSSPSIAVVQTNASSLSSSNYNLVQWPAQAPCRNGFNVYGRTSGSMVYLATVGPTAHGTNQPSGGTSCAPGYCYVDTGATAPGDSFTISFANPPAYPAVKVWALRNWNNVAATPIDTASVATNAGSGSSLTAYGITTAENNETQMVDFGMNAGAGTFTNPGGFSNVVSIGGALGANQQEWGATKNIATASTTANATGTTLNSLSWATIDFGVRAANTATPITVVGDESVVSSGPTYGSVTFSDPTGTMAGDLLIVCMTFVVDTTPVVPNNFNLIASPTIGGAGNTREACYWVVAAGSPAPPTFNSSGSLYQSTTLGSTYHEYYLGLQNWDISNDPTAPNGGDQAETSFVAPMIVTGCFASWHGYAGCSPYPTWVIKDTTANVILCSQTVSNSNTNTGVTPSSNSVPGGDTLLFTVSTPGSGCSAGSVHMSIEMHQ